MKKITIIVDKIKRGHYLYFFYYYLYTLCMDRHIAGTYKYNRSLNKLIYNNERGASPVQSTSYRVLDVLLPELEIGDGDIFVDVGSGWGRLLGYLFIKGKKCRKYYGIELNSEAADLSKKILRNYDQVEIINGDATKVIINDATVYFLFSPFDRNVMELWIKHIENTHSYVKVYYLHAIHEKAFANKPKWRIIKRKLLRPKYHIPVTLCVYEYGNR